MYRPVKSIKKKLLVPVVQNESSQAWWHSPIVPAPETGGEHTNFDTIQG